MLIFGQKSCFLGPPKSKLHIPTDVRLDVNCQAYNYMACALEREKMSVHVFSCVTVQIPKLEPPPGCIIL